jgi:hypothetical protein
MIFYCQVMARGSIVSRGMKVQEFKKKQSLWDIFSGRRRRAVEEDEENDGGKPIGQLGPFSPRGKFMNTVEIVFIITTVET